MPNGDGGGFNFGGLFNPLIGALVAVVNAIIAFLNALVNVLVQVLNFLYAGEVGIFGFSFKSLTQIYKSIRNLVDQVFKVWVSGAINHLWSLYQKITRWVRKLKEWLDRLQRIQQLQLMQALRRYLNLIQRIRRILVVFKLLHIGIAKKLDDYLAKIEGKVSGRVFAMLRKQNEIIRWINLVADPRGLLHGGAVGASLGSMIRAVRGALAALRPGEFNCVPGQQTGPGVTVRPWLDVHHQLLRESREQSGDSAAVARQFAQIRELFAQDLGNVQSLRRGV